MKKHYLMLKIHNKTGLKYLCKCSTKDEKYCYQYHGSGKYWKRHLNKHGKDVRTIIIARLNTNEELAKVGELYSKFWDVVNNKSFANLIPETGQGGFSENARIKARSKEARIKRAKTLSQLYSGKTKEVCERVKRMALTKANRTKEKFNYIKEQAKKISKGTYHTPWGDFISPEDAAKARGVTAYSSIRKACNKNNNKIISKYASTVVKWFPLVEGKTYKEMGFGFTAK